MKGIFEGAEFLGEKKVRGELRRGRGSCGVNPRMGHRPMATTLARETGRLATNPFVSGQKSRIVAGL